MAETGSVLTCATAAEWVCGVLTLPMPKAAPFGGGGLVWRPVVTRSTEAEAVTGVTVPQPTAVPAAPTGHLTSEGTYVPGTCYMCYTSPDQAGAHT